MKATNIQWDTDGKSIDLPSEVIIPDNIAPGNVEKYLSDTYEFCVKEFVLEK